MASGAPAESDEACSGAEANPLHEFMTGQPYSGLDRHPLMAVWIALLLIAGIAANLAAVACTLFRWSFEITP